MVTVATLVMELGNTNLPGVCIKLAFNEDERRDTGEPTLLYRYM